MWVFVNKESDFLFQHILHAWIVLSHFGLASLISLIGIPEQNPWTVIIHSYILHLLYRFIILYESSCSFRGYLQKKPINVFSVIFVFFKSGEVSSICDSHCPFPIPSSGKFSLFLLLLLLFHMIIDYAYVFFFFLSFWLWIIGFCLDS